MKIRNGFVSNSSSSSFVILGVKTDDEMDYKEMRSLGLNCLHIDEGCYTGIVISDDEYLEESFTSFKELHEMAQKVADALKVDINEVELITGTRSS